MYHVFQRELQTRMNEILLFYLFSLSKLQKSIFLEKGHKSSLYVLMLRRLSQCESNT